MFFPDKVRAHQESRRVLRLNGHYLLVSFDRLELNPVPNAAGNAVAALFPDDPPACMERGPFSYADPALTERDLLAAGFTRIQLEVTGTDTSPIYSVRRRMATRPGSLAAMSCFCVQYYTSGTARSARSRSVQRSSTASIPTLSRNSVGGRCSCPGMLARRSMVDSTAPRLVAC